MPSVTWQLATVMTSAAGVSSTWAHWPGLSGLFRWDKEERAGSWNLVPICLDPPGFPLLIFWCCLFQSQPKGKDLPNWPLFFFLFLAMLWNMQDLSSPTRD